MNKVLEKLSEVLGITRKQGSSQTQGPEKKPTLCLNLISKNSDTSLRVKTRVGHIGKIKEISP